MAFPALAVSDFSQSVTQLERVVIPRGSECPSLSLFIHPSAQPLSDRASPCTPFLPQQPRIPACILTYTHLRVCTRVPPLPSPALHSSPPMGSEVQAGPVHNLLVGRRLKKPVLGFPSDLEARRQGAGLGVLHCGGISGVAGRDHLRRVISGAGSSPAPTSVPVAPSHMPCHSDHRLSSRAMGCERFWSSGAY